MTKLIAESTQELRGYDDRFGNTTTTMFDKEKFAKLITKRSAEFAAKYWNDAGLQRSYLIQEYITLAMQDGIKD